MLDVKNVISVTPVVLVCEVVLPNPQEVPLVPTLLYHPSPDCLACMRDMRV